MHFPWLSEPQLVDVSDVVAELAKKHGKPLASAEETARVKGVWRAVPQYHTFFVGCYREDLFKKASLKVPDTWEISTRSARS
jgi:ABC-type glycerol-3-phosphate transport system substrate-binding protein